MKRIILEKITLDKNGNFETPHPFYKSNRVVITTPYAKYIICSNGTHQIYFRRPGKDKPFIEDGYISFKDSKKEEKFKVVDQKGNIQLRFSKVKRIK